MNVCGLELAPSWAAALVIGAVLGTALLLLASGADWLERRYERRETVRRLAVVGHAHRWLVGDAVDGVARGECSCGDERMFVEGGRDG